MSSRLLIMILILIFGFFTKVNCELTQVVRTTKGPVQGRILKTIVDSKKYSSFKGIPYAEVPVGILRFRPPIEKKPWTKVLKATAEGANCPQMDFVYSDRFTGSEDCLYLNVHTPETDFKEKPKKLRPVIVWIYGGTFVSGYGNSSFYGPDFIIEDGVVLVTFNYRLGPLGFLSLNHENATGNAALKDQNLVLKWVQQNIDRFGGDPNKVTLTGQSAGGVAVDLHALSDMSKGLFHQAISMSASPLMPWAFHTSKDAEDQAFELGYRLGLSKFSKNKDALLELLYNASSLQLVEITGQMGGINPPFRPTIESVDVAKNEEKFLTECPHIRYTQGKFAKVAYLTGFTKEETVLFSNHINSLVDTLHFAAQLIKSIPSKIPFPPSFLNPFFSTAENNIEKIVIPTTVSGIISASTEFLFTLGVDIKQKYLHTNNNGLPIYYYRLSYNTEESLHRLKDNVTMDGVAHGDDLAYLFHMTLIKLPLDRNNPTFIMRRRLTRMWTNFAKYGNPTPHRRNELSGIITWPESGSSGKILDIDHKMTVEDRPNSPLMQLYQPIKEIILRQQTGCTSNTFSAILNTITQG